MPPTLAKKDPVETPVFLATVGHSSAVITYMIAKAADMNILPNMANVIVTVVRSKNIKE